MKMEIEMNSHGTNILHWYKSDKFKCSFTRTVNSTFSVPFGNVFHAVLWCCLRNVKKIKVTAHRTVTLTIRVNEPKNLQKHSRESRYSSTSPLRLLHHTGSRLRVRLQRAVGYNEQLSSHQNTAMLMSWVTG